MTTSTPKPKPNDNEGNEKRKGCGCCLNALAVGGLIFAVVITIGTQWSLNYIEKELFKTSSTTKTELNAWLKEPVNLPRSTEKPEPLPAELRARLEKLELDIDRTWESRSRLTAYDGSMSTDPVFTVMGHGVSSALSRILAGEDQTTSDTQAVDELASASKSLLPELHAVLGDPAFRKEEKFEGQVINSHYMISKSYNPNELRQDNIKAFLALHLAKDEISSATDLLSSSAKLIIKNPPEVTSYYETDNFLELVRAVSNNTSNPLELRVLLSTMKSNREGLLNLANDISFAGTEYANLARLMQTEGYLPRLPTTRAEILEVKFRMPQYLRELRKKYGEDSEKVKFVMMELESDGMIMEVVQYWPLRIGMRLFSGRLMTWLALESYDQWESEKSSVPDTVVNYDLLMAEIALRIALFEGKTVTSGNEIVPDYLDQMPNDPYVTPQSKAATDTTGTKTLRYSPENKWYYSVGPDGQDASGDEVLGAEVGVVDPYVGMI